MSEIGPIVVDCDPGLDDALALSYLAGAGIPIEAVIAVGGNLPVAATAANAAFVLHHLGLDTPVAIGLDPPLDRRRDATAFHGADGLGGLSRPGYLRAAPRTAADVLGEAWAAGRGVLASGPLTNVAAALPGPVGGRIVVMGGAFGRPAGNITPWAEFNWWSDPAAAGAVCDAGLTMSVVPLDVTQQVSFTSADANSLPDFVGSLLGRRIDLQRQAMGGDGAWVHDAVAAALMAAPELAHWRRGAVTVVAEGERAGEAALDTDGPGRPGAGVEVADEIDAPAVHAALMAAWSALSVIGP